MANSLSNYKIIRVTPTLSTDQYAVGDVLFTATEIPNAVLGDRGCSKLIAAYVLDQADNDFDATFIFSEGNTALGTINDTADISDSNMEGLNICGVTKMDVSQGSTGANIDTSRVNQMLPLSVTGENVTPLCLLQAASGSTSVFVQAIVHGETPTFAATDDLDLILHIQYK